MSLHWLAELPALQCVSASLAGSSIYAPSRLSVLTNLSNLELLIDFYDPEDGVVEVDFDLTGLSSLQVLTLDGCLHFKSCST